MKAAVLMLSAAALAAGGCVSRRAGVDVFSREWTVGRTTARDVVAAWGNPDSVRGDEWSWRGAREIGSKFKASYMMVGVTVSSSRRATTETRLRFDDRGVLVSRTVSESVPGGAEWTLNPFGD